MKDAGRPATVRRARARGIAVGLLAATIGLAGCSLHPNLDAAPPDPSASTRVVASDGTLLGTFDLGEHREPIPLTKMARFLQEAVIAIEDRRFYSHHGVDIRAIARALRDDIDHGKIVEGGSTITQQYVRNVLLTNEKTTKRKLREAILAVELERKYTKSQILERYLNAVYFGNGAYGAQAAAHRYFGVDADALTLAQSALLAGLLKSPEGYNPRHDALVATQRRNAVLDAMAANNYITSSAADTAKAIPIRLTRVSTRSTVAPFFVEQVRKWFLANPQFGATQAIRAHRLYQEGLTITTTLDPSAQLAAEASIRDILVDRHHDPAAALVAIEPTTGAVRAYVGGSDYATSQFDLAGQARRPTGSTFKTFVLAAALERHIPLSRQYAAPASLLLHPQDAPAWTVHNYDNAAFGTIDLLDATVHSVNTFYAQLMLDVGPQYAVDLARRLGISSPLDPIPGAVLGFNEASPLDMADAYATIAADGIHTAPVMVTNIVDRNGTTIYRSGATHSRAIASGIARAVNHTLEQVVSRGTGIEARIGRPVAGKTGTTDNYDDAWFAGSTPQLTTVVWVGSATTPEPMLPPRTRIKVTGGTWPTQIWARFMGSVLATAPADDFPQPSQTDTAGVLPAQALPAVVGMPAVQARGILADAGFAVGVTQTLNGDYPPGTVIDQSPDAHTATRAEAMVTITVAVAPASGVVVPQLLGLTAVEVAAAARHVGLRVDVQYVQEPAPGNRSRSLKTWKQSTIAGTRITPNSVVTVWVNRR